MVILDLFMAGTLYQDQLSFKSLSESGWPHHLLFGELLSRRVASATIPEYLLETESEKSPGPCPDPREHPGIIGQMTREVSHLLDTGVLPSGLVHEFPFFARKRPGRLDSPRAQRYPKGRCNFPTQMAS